MKSIGVGILPIHGTACLSGHSLIEPNFHPLHKTMYYKLISCSKKHLVLPSHSFNKLSTKKNHTCT